MIVDLNWHEYYAAACVGMLRKTQSIHKRHQDGHGAVMSSKPVYDSGWAVVSAASELAAAKALVCFRQRTSTPVESHLIS